MEQSTFFEIIKTLSKEERTEILQFAELPFINNGQMKAFVKPLLEYCFHNSPQSIEKSGLYEKLFNKKAENRRLEKVLVEANKVVRSFLLLKYYNREENDFFRTLDFAEIVRLRGLEDKYRNLLKKLDKMQENFPWKNTTYFQRQFFLDYAKYEFDSLHTNVKGVLHIPETVISLNGYYYMNILNLLNSYLLQKKLVNIIDTDELSRAMKIEIPESYLSNSPQLHINFEIFRLLSKSLPNSADIQDLFHLLTKNEKNLDAESTRISYSYLRNICTLVANTHFDDEEIRGTLFLLYKDNLNRGILHFEGKLHQSTYLAVTLIALITNHIDWTYEFINKYQNSLIGLDENQEVYRFNMALFYFANRKFEDCFDYIPPAFQSANYLLHAKRLEIKALYELNSDLLTFKLDSFKMFLSRTSPKFLSPKQKQLNIDFVNMMVQLVGTRAGDAKRSDRLANRIQNKKQIFEWRWLLEKAHALKK